MLSGELDANSTYLSINSGAGGTESCDWAMMLLRMYTRYADKHGYKFEILERSDGEEAGIKSCTVLISGEYAYGYLKAEAGVHRLVRIQFAMQDQMIKSTLSTMSTKSTLSTKKLKSPTHQPFKQCVSNS